MADNVAYEVLAGMVADAIAAQWVEKHGDKELMLNTVDEILDRLGFEHKGRDTTRDVWALIQERHQVAEYVSGGLLEPLDHIDSVALLRQAHRNIPDWMPIIENVIERAQ